MGGVIHPDLTRSEKWQGLSSETCLMKTCVVLGMYTLKKQKRENGSLKSSLLHCKNVSGGKQRADN